MARLFIGILKGVAFDWFRSLPPGSINSWIDLETRFLSRFYEDDTEVTMDKLLSTVQKKGKSIHDKLLSTVQKLISDAPSRDAIAHALANMQPQLSRPSGDSYGSYQSPYLKGTNRTS